MNNTTHTEKTLSLPMLACLLAVYLIIIQGVTQLLIAGQDFDYGKFPTIDALIRTVTIPVGLSVVFVAVVISWLGWWKRILGEKNRLTRWAWLIPLLMFLSIIVVTDYPQLASVSPTLTLMLLVSVCLVGIGEELMFRGIVLGTLRDLEHWSEIKAALWAALIFGGVHITNIFTEGPSALLQAVVVSVSGLFFYVALRVSGTLWVPIILHAAWDFSLFSGNIGADPQPSTLAVVAILTNIVLGLIVLVRWRAIWPKNAAPMKPG